MPTRKQYAEYQKTTYYREKIPTGDPLDLGVIAAAHWAGMNTTKAKKAAWLIMLDILLEWKDPFGDELLLHSLGGDVTGEVLWNVHRRLQDAITVGLREVECFARAVYAAIDPTEGNPLLAVIRSLTEVVSDDMLISLFKRYYKG